MRSTSVYVLAGKLLAVVILAFPFPTPQAQPLSNRQLVSMCWQSGAVNEWLMRQCTGGLQVSTQAFHLCMSGGPCFGEPPLGPPPPPAGFPFCGAMGLPYCFQPAPCGFPNTIACPPPPGFPLPPVAFAPACGAPPWPPCSLPQPCGQPHTLMCAPPVAVPQPPPSPGPSGLPFGTWSPTVQVSLPGPLTLSPGQINAGIAFAVPPIPDLRLAQQCRSSSANEQQLMACLVDRAMPPAYRLTAACLQRFAGDPGAAALCSSGRDDLVQHYQRMLAAQACAKQTSDRLELANCLGQQVLGENERYYANCLVSNRSNLSAAAVCGMSRDLTPEQQIALSCAMQTGGNPKAFAVCTGGQLLERELNKCWEHGIATDKGCFGPNNELRRFWNGVDGTLRNALGPNSVAYQAFNLYKNNVLAPGPNHEFIRAANTALGDLRRGGLGPNNDLVKAADTIGRGVQSVGNAVGRAIGVRF